MGAQNAENIFVQLFPSGLSILYITTIHRVTLGVPPSIYVRCNQTHAFHILFLSIHVHPLASPLLCCSLQGLAAQRRSDPGERLRLTIGGIATQPYATYPAYSCPKDTACTCRRKCAICV